MSDLLLKEEQSNSFRSVECDWNVGGYMINHIEDPKCVFKTIQFWRTREKSFNLTWPILKLFTENSFHNSVVLIESYVNLNAILIVATLLNK